MSTAIAARVPLVCSAGHPERRWANASPSSPRNRRPEVAGRRDQVARAARVFNARTRQSRWSPPTAWQPDGRQLLNPPRARRDQSRP